MQLLVLARSLVFSSINAAQGRPPCPGMVPPGDWFPPRSAFPITNATPNLTPPPGGPPDSVIGSWQGL